MGWYSLRRPVNIVFAVEGWHDSAETCFSNATGKCLSNCLLYVLTLCSVQVTSFRSKSVDVSSESMIVAVCGRVLLSVGCSPTCLLRSEGRANLRSA